MLEKDCPCREDDRRRFHARVSLTATLAVSIILAIILIVFLILRPSKPSFRLQDFTSLAFNASAGPDGMRLTSDMQLTLVTRNPNSRIGIFYDRLLVFAAYRGQEITFPTDLPGAYLGHGEVAVWSPFVFGNGVLVGPYLARALYEDERAGAVMVDLKVAGRVRWRVGSWVSGHYRLRVNCEAFIPAGGSGSGSIGVGMDRHCNVDV